MRSILNHEPFNLVLQSVNLGTQVTGIVGVDGNGDDRAGNTSGTAEGCLAGNVNIWNLV